MNMNRYIFDVFALDMIPGSDEGWIENERHLVGRVAVEAESYDTISDKNILKALKNFDLKTITGSLIPALNTTDRRRIFAEDYYGDGTWWEVGNVRQHKPCYGLHFRGATT